MNVINPGYEIVSDISPFGICELMDIERAARNCYRSEDKITDQAESARQLIQKLIDRGHEAMLEHSSLMVRFTCDRAIANEIVRHRVASFAQESTRYCNYAKKGLTFIRPFYLVDGTAEEKIWREMCERTETAYLSMIELLGLSPEEARCILPNCLATSLFVTANYREWRHILRLRTAKGAHPQMREIMVPLLNELKERIPVIFDDIDGGTVDATRRAWKVSV